MEKDVKIPIGNGKNLYGSLYGELKDSLVIFVHGCTGHKDEHIFYNGARYFWKKGFPSFRYDQYGFEKDARKFNNTPLTVSASDLDKVIKYFREQSVKNIFIVGHSWGALVVLLSKDRDFDRVVFWDPSSKPSEITNDAELINEKNLYYYSEWGVAFTLGKEMYEENKTIKPVDLIKKLKAPAKIISAGKGALIKNGRKYFETANDPKELVSIEGAGHNFNEEGVEEKLFSETLNWFK